MFYKDLRLHVDVREFFALICSVAHGEKWPRKVGQGKREIGHDEADLNKDRCEGNHDAVTTK